MRPGGGGAGGGGAGGGGGGGGGDAGTAFVDSSSFAALVLGGPADAADCCRASNMLVPPPTPGLTPDGGGTPGRRPRAEALQGFAGGDAFWRPALPTLGLGGGADAPEGGTDVSFSGWADTVAPGTEDAAPVGAAGKQHRADAGSAHPSCDDVIGESPTSTSPTTITPTPVGTTEPPPPTKGHQEAGPRRPTYGRQLTLPTTEESDPETARRSMAYWATVNGYSVSGEIPIATAARLSDAAAMLRTAPPSGGDGGGMGGGVCGGGGGVGGATGPLPAAQMYETAARAWEVATCHGSAWHLRALLSAGELYLSLRRLTDAGDRARAAIAAFLDNDGTGDEGVDHYVDPVAAAAAATAEYSAAHYLLGRVHVARGRAHATAERHVAAEQAYRDALEAYRVAYMVMLSAAAGVKGGRGEPAAAGRAAAPAPPPPAEKVPLAVPAERPLKVVRVTKAIQAVLHQLNATVAAQGRRLDITEATSAFEWPPPPLSRLATATGGSGGRR